MQRLSSSTWPPPLRSGISRGPAPGEPPPYGKKRGMVFSLFSLEFFFFPLGLLLFISLGWAPGPLSVRLWIAPPLPLGRLFCRGDLALILRVSIGCRPIFFSSFFSSGWVGVKNALRRSFKEKGLWGFSVLGAEGWVSVWPFSSGLFLASEAKGGGFFRGFCGRLFSTFCGFHNFVFFKK